MASIKDFLFHGWDISHHQDEAPDFRGGGRVFAFCKATQGDGYVDPHFKANRAAMRAQGLALRGYYHFATPLSHAAADEAAHFLAVLGTRGPGEWAVLDFEADPSNKSGKDFWSEAWAVTFINAVRAGGWPVMFYSYRAAIASHPHAQIQATGVPLWLAGYSTQAPSVAGWPWTFWQHTNGTSAPDANAPKWDCSVFHSNDMNELVAFAGGATQQGDADVAFTAEDKQWLTDLLYNQGKGWADLIIKTVKEHADDPGTGGGAGHVDVEQLEKEILDAMAKRLAA